MRHVVACGCEFCFEIIGEGDKDCKRKDEGYKERGLIAVHTKIVPPTAASRKKMVFLVGSGFELIYRGRLNVTV